MDPSHDSSSSSSSNNNSRADSTSIIKDSDTSENHTSPSSLPPHQINTHQHVHSHLEESLSSLNPRGGENNNVTAAAEVVPEKISHPLREDQERQDNEFMLCEVEYLDTLASLSGSDDQVAKFKQEYEKMHKAILLSRRHSAVLFQQFNEMHAEFSGNSSLAQEANRMTGEDNAVIENLKSQIKRNEEILDASSTREDAQKATLRTLKADVTALSTSLKSGVNLSTTQERALNELTATRDSTTKELESVLDRIVRLRENMSDVTDKIRMTDQQKRELERDIYELKERNVAKKTDIDSEMRNKERLDRDLRELRVVVAVKSQEVRGKQDSVNRATDEILILESQIRSQRQMLEKLGKDRDGLNVRKVKLQQECNEQMNMTAQLVEENNLLKREVVAKEADLESYRSELKKVNKIKEALGKKNKDLEDKRVHAEQERKDLKAQHDSKLAEIELVNRSIDVIRKAVDDLTRERDILLTNSGKTGTETIQHVQASLLYKQMRHNLDLELARSNKEVEQLVEQQRQLESQRDKYVTEATQLQALCVQSLQDIKEKEVEIFEYKKKMIKAETKLKHQQNLYEAVQSDRNLNSKHLIDSQAEISEMKRKLKIMNYQINGFKEEINMKHEAVVAEAAENSKLQKDIEIITDEVKALRNQNELAQAYIRSQLAEEMKLNMFVKEAEQERIRQENALHVLISERDNLSAQLIRQNEELARAYNKVKTQQTSLMISEGHYRDKLRAIRLELSEIHRLKESNRELDKDVAILEPSKRQIHRLRSDMLREKTRIKALEDELENPVNIHRWRKLEGNNPRAFEMIQLLQTLQRNLIARSAEEREKERQIDVQERLYLHLKGILQKQVGPEVIEQVDEFERTLKSKRAQLKHMGVELNMYQDQVKEHKHMIERLNGALKEIKDMYMDRRRTVGFRQFGGGNMFVGGGSGGNDGGGSIGGASGVGGVGDGVENNSARWMTGDGTAAGLEMEESAAELAARLPSGKDMPTLPPLPTSDSFEAVLDVEEGGGENELVDTTGVLGQNQYGDDNGSGGSNVFVGVDGDGDDGGSGDIGGGDGNGDGGDGAVGGNDNGDGVGVGEGGGDGDVVEERGDTPSAQI